MKDIQTGMYPGAKTWNPAVGCGFHCKYCQYTFQRQLKRQKGDCLLCYKYEPHTHPKRLKRIPSAEIVFVVGDGDICFCPAWFTREIIARIKEHNKKCPYKTYYFQSKNPAYFGDFIALLPENVILLTTLETNRDEGYEKISSAPKPSIRFKNFLSLDYPRKVLTIEPVMDFDLPILVNWVAQISPEYVWFGFNSKPNMIRLPEPSLDKAQSFINELKLRGIQVRGKELRGLRI
jgi:hypothetical protein